MSAVIIGIIMFYRFLFLSVQVGFVPSWGTKAEFFISFEDFRFFISFQIIVHQLLLDGSLTPSVVLA